MKRRPLRKNALTHGNGRRRTLGGSGIILGDDIRDFYHAPIAIPSCVPKTFWVDN